MKKFEGMLFCTDIDGTLYSDDRSVSKENFEAIEYFKSEGGLFTFITGRVPLTAKEICDAIHPNAPYGCINGGGVYDHVNNKYLWSVTLPDEVMEMVKFVDEEFPEIGVQFNTLSNIIFTKDNSAMEWFRKITGVPNVCCNFWEVKEPILKIVFAHENGEELDELALALNSHKMAGKFDFIRSEYKLYELLPKGSSKGNLLCKMAELLNVDPQKTIAVGDYNNDVSMVKAAGMGFAVANAVDEVKQVADYITVSNNEHAIAAIIEGIENGKFRVK